MSLGVMGSSAGAGGGCVTGTYTGNGNDVELTFNSPVKAMIISGAFAYSSYDTPKGNTFLAVAYGTACQILSWGINNTASPTPATTTITISGNSVTLPAAYFSRSGKTFNYIAFF